MSLVKTVASSIFLKAIFHKFCLVHSRMFCLISFFHFCYFFLLGQFLKFEKGRDVWLYVIIMSRRSFRVNLHFIVCLNVKELLSWSRRHIWSLNDSNRIRTHDHLVRKRTLNHLAKSVCLNGWVLVYELSGCEFKFRFCYLGRDVFKILSKIYDGAFSKTT